MRLTKRYLKRLVLEALEDASPSEDEDPPYQSSYPGGEHTSFMDEFRAGPPQEVEDVAKELADLYWDNKGQPDTEEIKEMLEKLRSLGMHGVDKAQDLAMTKGGSQRWSYPPGGFDESKKPTNINKRTLKRMIREQLGALKRNINK